MIYQAVSDTRQRTPRFDYEFMSNVGCGEFTLDLAGAKSPTLGVKEDPTRYRPGSNSSEVGSPSDELGWISPTQIHPLIMLLR
jgi:hypothetical protein